MYAVIEKCTTFSFKSVPLERAQKHSFIEHFLGLLDSIRCAGHVYEEGLVVKTVDKGSGANQAFLHRVFAK